MNEVIIYLLKVVAIHGLLYLFYWLFLRKSKLHALNRGFLLGSLLIAFIIPFIQLPIPEQTITEATSENIIITWLAEPTISLTEVVWVPIDQSETFNWWSIIPWIYGGIVLILIIRSVFYLTIIQRLKKHSEYVSKRWYKLFKTPHDRPFSFFSNVFIPRSLFGAEGFGQILAHECVHVRQFHSLDRLLLDFVGSLFWFNPFIYLYRNALIEIHEYQADEQVINRFKDPIGYQEILFSQLKTPQYSGLVSHFNVEMIKKRIVMMNKPNKRTGWIHILALPVTLMIVFAFSSKEAMKPINDVGNEISSLIGPIDLTEVADDLFQEDYEPSILPLKKSDMTRMSSAWGKRKDPIDNQIKMHTGVDFVCPIGTEILATADGVIAQVQNKPGGYGKLLTIKHGDVFQTRYAQLSDFKVEEGDKVKKGQVVALSGNSGRSTGPHLHYEVLKDGKRVNPMSYIKNYRPVIKEIPSSKSSNSGEENERIEKERRMLEELKEREKEEFDRREEKREKEEELLKAYKERENAEKEQLIAMEKKIFKKMKEEEMKLANPAGIKIEGTKGDPLYVLDDVVVKKEELKTLKPDQIQTVTVLKDKSAKKKYGSKGENGVVEIKTKEKIKTKVKEKMKVKEKKKD